MKVTFTVSGTPVPKQSYRHSSTGGYKSEAVAAWEQEVRMRAREAYHANPICGPVAVELRFTLPDRRRRDLDNLSKAILDSINGEIFEDDNQIVELRASKVIGTFGACGVMVEVRTI